MHPIKNVAIIGAGIAGLSAARVLTEAGIAVTVFDKGRQPGGRLATRRVQNWTFNHGCQFFTIRDPGFETAVRGGSAPWPLAGEGRFAGVPNMATIANHLATGLDVRQHAHVKSVARRAARWVLRFDDGEDHGFEGLIVAVPAPQAVLLLAGLCPDFETRLQSIHLAPCWAVMLGFETPAPRSALDIQLCVPPWPEGIWASLRGGSDSQISWAVRESARPNAPAAPPAFTFHCSAAWSTQHLDDRPEDIIAAVLQGGWAFGTQKPAYAAAHRWRYALVEKPLGEDCLWDPATNLGLCGDWCLAPRLEAAFISGRALAKKIIA